MTAKILDGKHVADCLISELSETIAQHATERPPGLAVIIVGTDAASQIYVRNKHRACERAGIISFAYELPASVTETELVNIVKKLNNDATVDGILVQLPLPAHINEDRIVETIDPRKDVDGFHPYNLGRLAQRRPLIRPCTPMGIIALLKHYHIETKGMDAVIVGASNIVGRPLALELLIQGATVTTCHRFTRDIQHHIQRADLVVSATGIRNIIAPEWVRDEAIVIDVGIHRLDDGTLCGDLNFAAISQHAAWMTPVPGGVGPMTIASLLLNTYEAYARVTTDDGI